MKTAYWTTYAIFWVVWLLWTFVLGLRLIGAITSNVPVMYGIFLLVAIALPLGARAAMMRGFPDMADEKGRLPGWRGSRS